MSEKHNDLPQEPSYSPEEIAEFKALQRIALELAPEIEVPDNLLAFTRKDRPPLDDKIRRELRRFLEENK